ncbi:MAG: hypothetical protein K2N13_02045 [Paraprevotella sp.]|nr:hypothetical protein [Paraprevotella sp.]
MKKILFILSAILFAQPYAAMSQTGRQKVAVYMTGEITNEAYKKVIGSKMVSEIAQSDEYIAVERTADFLKELAKEQDYQTSGEVRDNQIVQIGQKFGVRYVAVVDLSEVFEELFIAARLIDIQTGQIDKAYETAGQVGSMTELAELAQDVAGGLILCNGNSSSGGGSIYSNSPFPMALAVEKDGKRYYLTPEQWNKMAETKKIYYKKLGLVIIQNGDGFIMSLPSPDKIGPQRQDNFPSESQFAMIIAQKDMIRSTLKKLNHPYDNLQFCSWSNLPGFNSKDGTFYYYFYENDKFQHGFDKNRDVYPPQYSRPVLYITPLN